MIESIIEFIIADLNKLTFPERVMIIMVILGSFVIGTYWSIRTYYLLRNPGGERLHRKIRRKFLGFFQKKPTNSESSRATLKSEVEVSNKK